ncbi:MAG: hypothetical protein CVU56_24275 [Deltaproteobacteria bacterium HGW-Deltaproteobacteria-14]|nr:MAG: hypothetical protein CVU56_24275 [Deltaproteobacteria bacterium HGW-Deltaproteobacteria-14]
MSSKSMATSKKPCCAARAMVRSKSTGVSTFAVQITGRAQPSRVSGVLGSSTHGFCHAVAPGASGSPVQGCAAS